MRKLFLFLVLSLALTPWAGEQWQFTILHTNDLHGMLQPFDYIGVPEQGQPARENIGGLARRATAIAQLRREITNPLAVIDCGDLFTRGPWSLKFYGVPEIEALNCMGYDMLCVGNDEFKATGGTRSQAKMLLLMRRSRFPWLAANLTVGDTGVPVEGIHPFIVRSYGTVRVGFLGLTAPRSKDYPQVKGWTVADPIATAKKWVPIARKECDILIAVTHIGVDLDVLLAGQVAGIDAIVGGDSHTYLEQPKMVKNPAGVAVPIVQDGEWGAKLGRLDLTFEHGNDGWHLVKSAGKLILIDKSYADDPAVKALLDRYLAPTPAKVGELRWRRQPPTGMLTAYLAVRRTPVSPASGRQGSFPVCASPALRLPGDDAGPVRTPCDRSLPDIARWSSAPVLKSRRRYYSSTRECSNLPARATHAFGRGGATAWPCNLQNR